jgi:hypothetical protein
MYSAGIKTPAGETRPGLAFAGEIGLKGYLVVNLAELERLHNDGLLVMAEAAAEADGCRNDDGASNKQTHWLVPRFFLSIL